MTTVSATDRLLIGAKEVARLLSIVPSTLWSWHSAGKLPAPIRLGGRTLWRRAELEAWVAAGCPSRERWETFREGAR